MSIEMISKVFKIVWFILLGFTFSSCSKGSALRDVDFNHYSKFDECWQIPGESRGSFSAIFRVFQYNSEKVMIDPVSVRCRLKDRDFNSESMVFSIGLDGFTPKSNEQVELLGREVISNRIKDAKSTFKRSVFVKGKAEWALGPGGYGMILKVIEIDSAIPADASPELR